MLERTRKGRAKGTWREELWERTQPAVGKHSYCHPVAQWRSGHWKIHIPASLSSHPLISCQCFPFVKPNWIPEHKGAQLMQYINASLLYSWLNGEGWRMGLKRQMEIIQQGMLVLKCRFLGPMPDLLKHQELLPTTGGRVCIFSLLKLENCSVREGNPFLLSWVEALSGLQRSLSFVPLLSTWKP